MLGVAALALLVLVLFQIPGADTLGLCQDLKLDFVNLLAGVKTSGGMWWSLVGLAMVVAGLAAEELNV